LGRRGINHEGHEHRSAWALGADPAAAGPAGRYERGEGVNNSDTNRRTEAGLCPGKRRGHRFYFPITPDLRVGFRIPCDTGPIPTLPRPPVRLGSSVEEEFCCSDEHGNLADPKEEHPLDDLRFDIGTILLCHESLGQIIFLLAKGQFQTLGNGAGLGRLDLRRLQDRKYFRGAHPDKRIMTLLPAVKPPLC